MKIITRILRVAISVAHPNSSFINTEHRFFRFALVDKVLSATNFMVRSAILFFLQQFVQSLIPFGYEQVDVVVDEDVSIDFGLQKSVLIAHFIKNVECLLVLL